MIALVLVLFLPSSSAALYRLPYITAVTSSSAIITFGVTEPNNGAGTIQLDTDNNNDAAITATTIIPTSQQLLEWYAYPNDYNITMVQHRAALTNLPPSAEVCYTVLINNISQHPTSCFVTAPPASSLSTVRFLAWGDFGVASQDQADVSNAMRDGGHFDASDFMLALGDNSYFYGKHHEYDDRVFPYYHHLWDHKPLVLTSGNHDYQLTPPDNDDWSGWQAAAYRTLFEQYTDDDTIIDNHKNRYFAFDWSATAHFASADTEFETVFDAGEQQAMIDWIENDLSSSRAQAARWRVFFLHKTPYAYGGVADDAVVERIMPVLERNKVDVVVGGHWHKYERYAEANGITNIVSGGGGYALLGEYEVDEATGRLVLNVTAPNLNRNKPHRPTVMKAVVPELVVDITQHHYLSFELSECVLRMDAWSKEHVLLDSFAKVKC